MAEASAEKQQSEISQEGQRQQKLKYLAFVHLAAMQAVVCFSRLYDFAKENSGPLKPGVQTVEGTVKTVIGPVYDKFHDVPYELLKFVDCKVDKAASELECHVPPVLKEASSQAYTAAQKAPEVARSMASEVQRAGVVGTATGLAKSVVTKCEPTVKDMYARYEPVAEQYAVSAWRALNRLPLFPQVAQIVVPTAAHWSEKYNSAVCYSAEKGYAVASYMPLVPTERIAKVFGSTAPPGADNGSAGGATAAAVAQ